MTRQRRTSKAARFHGDLDGSCEQRALALISMCFSGDALPSGGEIACITIGLLRGFVAFPCQHDWL